MQKIIIKNFGPIQEAEIELKKVLVLIGEQASGKSTIARLIYFFKTLRQDFYIQFTNNSAINFFTEYTHFMGIIQTKFYDYFGATQHLPPFEITYYYNTKNNKFIALKFDKDKKLNIVLSEHFLDAGLVNIIEIFGEELDINNRKVYKNQMLIQINALFEIKQIIDLFVIAGRNATVSYSELFEKRCLFYCL